MEPKIYSKDVDKIKSEYEKAIRIAPIDPGDALFKARLIAESIAGFVCKTQDLEVHVRSGKKPTFNDFITPIEKYKIIHENVLKHFGTILAYGNLAAHELADYTYDYISSAIASLTYVFNWFCSDYIKNLEYFAYDFFICFTQPDKEWVQKNLYEALLKFQSINKKPLRIFFKENSEIKGQNYYIALASVLQESRKIIWVCSENLFKDPENEFVLKKSFELDPIGDKKRIVQLQIDDNFTIPFEYKQNQILKTSGSNWFSTLTNWFELVKIDEIKPHIQFLSKIEDCTVNLTLPSVQISLSDRTGPNCNEKIIELSCKNAILQGTLDVETKNGIAEFSDLSFRSAGNNVQIQAITNDYSGAVSNKIKVSEADTRNDPSKPFITNLFCSRITGIFLGKSFIVIVTEDSNISMIDLQGNELFNTKLNLPLKFIRVSGNILTFGDWDGNVYIQTPDKKSFHHHFSAKPNVYSVPSDAFIDSETVLIAFWNGEIYSYDKVNKPKIVLHHQEGINYFFKYKDVIYLLDWKNDFVGYSNNGVVFRHSLEKEVISMHLIGDVIIIVGKNKLYHYSIPKKHFINISNFVKNTKHSFDNGHYLFLVDEEGKGTCTDSELIKRYYSFFTTKGAIPVCSDTSGNYAIFKYPDKTSVLLKKGKIIKSHHNSAFYFDSSLSKLLIGTDSEIMIYPSPDMERIK